MIGPKISSGTSVNSFRSTSTESKTPEAGWKQTSQNSTDALSNNPVLRSVRGESSFEGPRGPGAARMQEASERGPRDMLQQLGEAIKELVATLEQRLGEQAGATVESSSAVGDTSGTDAAPAADAAEAAQETASADESEQPLQKILETLKQLLGLLEQLQQGQGTAADSSTDSAAVPASDPQVVTG